MAEMSDSPHKPVHVIGGGLAGSEAAFQIAARNVPVNAFATPGGYVYFYRGLLAHFNSEAELAGVLSHEIAHITARHAVRGMSTAQVTNLIIGIAASSLNVRGYPALFGPQPFYCYQ